VVVEPSLRDVMRSCVHQRQLPIPPTSLGVPLEASATVGLRILAGLAAHSAAAVFFSSAAVGTVRWIRQELLVWTDDELAWLTAALVHGATSARAREYQVSTSR
jgi:hypothetical protein